MDQEAKRKVSVIVQHPGWRRLVPRVEQRVRRAVAAACMPNLSGVSVILADDRLLRSLNLRHRGRNKPTNVLTYTHPAPELIIALGVVRREAAAANRSVADHLMHMVVHGTLHLLDHDHDRPGDARRMEMAEPRVLGRLDVPNPWKPAYSGRS